eukprot:10025614-Lingulodinium_polyedra.AAC.1
MARSGDHFTSISGGSIIQLTARSSTPAGGRRRGERSSRMRKPPSCRRSATHWKRSPPAVVV